MDPLDPAAEANDGGGAAVIAVACGRTTRPGVLGLIAVLAVMVALLPALAGAPRASADICDAPVIAAGCSVVGTAVGVGSEVVDTVGGGLIDLGRWAIQGVSTAVSWSAEHVGTVVKTLAAAGIAVGVWVACSKVLKALSSDAGGALAGAETDGAGTAAGKLGGAAAAGMACNVARAGGRLLLKVGKRVLRAGGALSKIAKLAATATGLAAIVYGTQHAADWVLENLLDIDGHSGRELGDRWVAEIRSDLNGIAGVLLVLVAIVALAFAALRGGLGEPGGVLGGLVGAAVLVAIVGSLIYAAVVWTDAITNGLVHSHWGQRALGNWRDLGDAYGEVTPAKGAGHAVSSLLSSANPTAPTNGTPGDDGSGAPWILRLLIAALTVFFGALAWVELQIREGALLLLLIFSGLVFSSFAWPRHRGVGTAFAMLILGVIVAKLVIVVTLLVGGSLTQTAAAGDASIGPLKGMLIGVGLMGLAAFGGWWTVSWFGLHGAGTLGQVSATLRGGSLAFLPGGRGGSVDQDRRRGDGGERDSSPPAPPGGGAGVARELAVDAAARLPGTGGETPIGVTGDHPGADRIHQAREQERRRASTGTPTEAAHATTSAPGSGEPEPAPADEGANGHADIAATADTAGDVGRDSARAEQAGESERTDAEREARGGLRVGAVAHIDAGDSAPTASPGPNGAGDPPLASPSPLGPRRGTVDTGEVSRTLIAEQAGSSLDAVAKEIGLPADRLATAIETVAGSPTDVEAVQRAFGQHADSVWDYLRWSTGYR